MGLQQPTKILARQRGKLTEFAPSLGLQQPTKILARQRGKLTEFALPLGLQQPTRILARQRGKLKNLLYLYNTLTTLPKTVGDMKSLIWVDVRHNGLTDLPSSVSQWSNIEYLYLAGNPLCADLDIPSNLKGVKGLCEQQCSADCPAHWLGRYECDDNDYTYEIVQANNIPINVKPKPNSGCNTAACEYDKGECPR